MNTALIGHRGTGKTTLLSRIETYFREAGLPVECLDLDREIERHQGASIEELFRERGELGFRCLEKNAFLALLNRPTRPGRRRFLALGAGFDLALLPREWNALWVRRSSDSTGRIFTDRPRLNESVDPLEEYTERFQARESRYREAADQVLWLDEGLEAPNSAEKSFFLETMRNIGGAITLLPFQFTRPHSLRRWSQRHVEAGVRWFELRDDLLSADQLRLATELVPRERVLVSFRDLQRENSTKKIVRQLHLAFDWPAERGACSWERPAFYSLHARSGSQSLEEALEAFPKQIPEGTKLKAALPTYTFAELEAGDAWQRKNPKHRSFLPISPDGRWAWYRLLRGNSLPLNFLCETNGLCEDQPFLLPWTRRSVFANELKESGFAAVLGDPVRHSRTPVEHEAFFRSSGAPVFAIQMTENDLASGALHTLRRLGLRWAAVTAPLKSAMYELTQGDSTAQGALPTVNTLAWNDSSGRWQATSTDIEGMRKSIRAAALRDPIAIWGGGGTLPALKALFPEAQQYSVRTCGNRRSCGKPAASIQPHSLIWAARANAPEPPTSWSPKIVFDLNYAEGSAARAFAARVGASYVSGIALFRAQAAAQRRFWDQYGRDE